MTKYRNSAEGGTDAGAVTPANSGGDSGDAWTSVTLGAGSTITYTAAQAAHGALGYLISPATSQTAYLRKDVEASVTTVLLSFYFRFASVPAAESAIAHIRNATTDVAALQITTSPMRFRVYNDANTLLFTSATIAANTWYRVEFRAIRGTTTGNGTIEFAYYVGDLTTPVETAFTTSTTNAGTTDLTNVRVGRAAAQTDNTLHYVDSVQVATAGDAGALGLVWPTDVAAVPAIIYVTPVAGTVTATAGIDVTDLQVPSPTVDVPDLAVQMFVTGSNIAAAGDYRVAASLFGRFVLLSGDTDFRGYAAEIARHRSGATEQWSLVLKRYDAFNTTTELDSASLLPAQVVLPGLLTLTVDGTSIGATFSHLGTGGTMTISGIDATYNNGAVALLGRVIAGVSDFAQITVDSFTATGT